MRLSQPAWSRWYLALVLAAWWVGAAGRAAAAEMVVNSELMRLPQGAIERAVSARLTATPLAWPLTLHVPLSQAVALLNGSGNATRLAEGLDGAAVADLPLLAGDYWQGVQMVCNAYDLVLEPGEGMDQAEDAGRFSGRENVGTAVIMQGGAVVLAHRPEKTSRPILLPCGVVLGVVSALDVRQRRGAAPNRTLDAQIDLRLEPHVLPGQVGVSMVAWSGVEDAAGRKLEFGEGGSPRAVAGLPLHLTKMPDRLKAVQLSGELLVQMIEPITLTATLSDSNPYAAALKGAAEIGFTVLTISISLIAVFIPLLLMGGIVGRLLREFAITLSVAILVSMVVSLTATPMMCAHLLREVRSHGWLYRTSERGFNFVVNSYGRALKVVLRHSFVTLLVLL